MKDVEERLKTDFNFFLYCVWKHLGLPNPTPLQYDIGDYLVSGPKRMIIEAFRGCGKSFITSAFVIWKLYQNPQLKIMVVSASKERADAFSSFTKRLIAEVEWLAHLKATKGQRDSLISFDVGPARVDHSPSVKSVGITGQLTGSRADIIIADDVEVPNNSWTLSGREKLAEQVTEFDAILKPYDARIMDAEPRIIYLGTPQTMESLYNLLRERGYSCRIWPAQMPEDTSTYKGALAPYVMAKGLKPGEPVDPDRFTLADLKERRRSYGKAGYALQFMLDTSLSDTERFPLKLADLIVADCDIDKAPEEYAVQRGLETLAEELPVLGLTGDRFYNADWRSQHRKEYTGRVMVIDPSGRGADETVWCVQTFLNGYVHLLKIDGCTDGYCDKTLNQIVQCAKNYKVNLILIESNFGDGMFSKLLEPHLSRVYPCSIEEIKVTTQKERRIIEVMEPVMMQHRLVVDRKVIVEDYERHQLDPKYSLFYQMTRLTDERNCLPKDDRIDCVHLGLAYWTEHMNADAKRIAHRARQEEIDKLVRSPELLFSAGSTVRGATNRGNSKSFI